MAYQQRILDCLFDEAPYKTKLERAQRLEANFLKFENEEPQLLAKLFVEACWLVEFFEYLKGQWWLETDKEKNFSSFSAGFFSAELLRRTYLRPYLVAVLPGALALGLGRLTLLREALVQRIRLLPVGLRSQALVFAVQLIKQEFLEEEVQPFKDSGTLSLFRAFDSLDDLVGVDYSTDGKFVSGNIDGERLYEGAGPGVQSSYSSLFSLLNHCELPEGARIVDLGSGFGRLGYLVGLWNSQWTFAGFEMVLHRVLESNRVTRDLRLDRRIKFFEKDLSDEEFILPEAELYYLFDPFHPATYERILAQLDRASRQRHVAIATKGKVKEWFGPGTTRDTLWKGRPLDAGNLWHFRST